MAVRSLAERSSRPPSRPGDGVAAQLGALRHTPARTRLLLRGAVALVVATLGPIGCVTAMHAATVLHCEPPDRTAYGTRTRGDDARHHVPSAPITANVHTWSARWWPTCCPQVAYTAAATNPQRPHGTRRRGSGPLRWPSRGFGHVWPRMPLLSLSTVIIMPQRTLADAGPPPKTSRCGEPGPATTTSKGERRSVHRGQRPAR